MTSDEMLCKPGLRDCPDAMSMKEGSVSSVWSVSTCPVPLRRDGDQIDLGAICGDATGVRRALKVPPRKLVVCRQDDAVDTAVGVGVDAAHAADDAALDRAIEIPDVGLGRAAGRKRIVAGRSSANVECFPETHQPQARWVDSVSVSGMEG
jgi:hypothetical protein